MITEYLCCSNKVTSEDIQKFEIDHTFGLLHITARINTYEGSQLTI